MASEMLDYLLSTSAIRERCEQLFTRVERGESDIFSLELSQLENVADQVCDVIRDQYPNLDIPYHSRWNHFRVGGVDRVSTLGLEKLDAEARGMAEYDLVITSVLLDAGAGPKWSFSEEGRSFARSEGLAVASFHAFAQGLFSNDDSHPYRVDGAALEAITPDAVGAAFQVNENNPLVGLEGRAALLKSLGAAVQSNSRYFGDTNPRPGYLFKVLLDKAREQSNTLEAHTVLSSVLGGLGSIWPGRVSFEGQNLGDVWYHEAVEGEGQSEGLVAFHKLSQWLSYSLLEPLEAAGVTITGMDRLTGLAEYRNGGLFIDGGVIALKDLKTLDVAHRPDSKVVIEWRALTVCLLDRIAPMVRERLGLDAQSFPLAKVLEGGTWATGRKLAAKKRETAAPPLRIDSDGTVF